MTHHILIIHGIGKAVPGYSAELREGVRRAAEQITPGASGPWVFHEIVWDDIVAVEQARLADVLRRSFGLAAPEPVSWLGRLLGGPKRFINKLRTDIAAEYIEDILSYRERRVYGFIHTRLNSVLDRVARAGQDDAPAVFSIIAHSLGTVIASDHIYDTQKLGRSLAGRVMFRNFFTLGSPIALFALQYGGVELFKSPARLEDPGGVWLNIFDKDDPIAYPLKTLNDAYNGAVTEDARVSTGLFGIAHKHYFDNARVHELIARNLIRTAAPAVGGAE